MDLEELRKIAKEIRGDDVVREFLPPERFVVLKILGEIALRMVLSIALVVGTIFGFYFCLDVGSYVSKNLNKGIDNFTEKVYNELDRIDSFFYNVRRQINK